MTHPTWVITHPRMTPEGLGFLPAWLDTEDPRGAADQLDSNYPWGGFKHYTFTGFKAGKGYTLHFPGDPVLRPLAMTALREEIVCLYPADIVAVWQKDGTFVAARFD